MCSRRRGKAMLRAPMSRNSPKTNANNTAAPAATAVPAATEARFSADMSPTDVDDFVFHSHATLMDPIDDANSVMDNHGYDAIDDDGLIDHSSLDEYGDHAEWIEYDFAARKTARSGKQGIPSQNPGYGNWHDDDLLLPTTEHDYPTVPRDDAAPIGEEVGPTAYLVNDDPIIHPSSSVLSDDLLSVKYLPDDDPPTGVMHGDLAGVSADLPPDPWKLQTSDFSFLICLDTSPLPIHRSVLRKRHSGERFMPRFVSLTTYLVTKRMDGWEIQILGDPDLYDQ